MEYDPNKIASEVVARGDDWADKEEAATLLDEAKKSVLAELKLLAINEKSDAAKEMHARVHPRYKEYLVKMVGARKDANKARVRYDAARMWADGLRTKAANLRAEMKL